MRIDGTTNNGDRLFTHNVVGGKLTLQDVTMGSNTSGPAGGCIFSKGQVSAYHSRFDHCIASGLSAAAGGAIAAVDVKLVDTQISACEAKPGGSLQHAYGGAVFASGSFEASFATLSGNAAARSYGLGDGGAVAARKGARIDHSTVSANFANETGSGILVTGGTSVVMRESTVSGNFGSVGLEVRAVADVQIDNSTIAFNVNYGALAGGLLVATFAESGGIPPPPTNVLFRARSSIFSNNVGEGSQITFAQKDAYSVTFDGTSSHNLFQHEFPLAPPGASISGCPHLGKLRDNGGLTATHALNSGSIALGAGSNPNGDAGDQRDVDAAKNYPRESFTGEPDIGAYEMDRTEVVFTSDLEGCGP